MKEYYLKEFDLFGTLLYMKEVDTLEKGKEIAFRKVRNATRSTFVINRTVDNINVFCLYGKKVKETPSITIVKEGNRTIMQLQHKTLPDAYDYTVGMKKRLLDTVVDFYIIDAITGELLVQM